MSFINFGSYLGNSTKYLGDMLTHDFLGDELRALGTGKVSGSTIIEESLFGSEVPTNFAADPTNYTLGTTFLALADCEVIKLRFYRALGDAVMTTRTLHLWTSAGVLMTSVETTETISTEGWLEFDITPEALTAGQYYVCSYDVNLAAGTYAAVNNYFSSGFDRTLIRAIANNENLLPNGRYWDAQDTFPTGNHLASNYFADVVVRAV